MKPGTVALPVQGSLGVVERRAAYFVIVDADPEDWLVRFDDSDDFPARDWAERMARTYNERREVNRSSQGA